MPTHPDSPPDFTPIPRKMKCCDGWTVARQRGFIAALARTGSVRVATESVGMSYANVHKLRQNQGAESFCRAWDAAIEQATGRISEVMIDHAVNGVPETIVRGKRRIERRRFNHRIMMWLLQHHRPAKYGGGYRSAFARAAEPPEPYDPDAEDAEEAALIDSIMVKLDAARAELLREVAHGES